MLFNRYFNGKTYFPSANKRTNGVWIGRKKHANYVPWTIGAVILCSTFPIDTFKITAFQWAFQWTNLF